MDIRPLTGELPVAPQINALDLRALCDANFKSVICHRPDAERADQPTFDEIERAACTGSSRPSPHSSPSVVPSSSMAAGC
jgi:sulfide:quinone oxidoreductase